MAYRKDISITTPYTSIKGLKETFLDHEGMPKTATTWNRGLWGSIEDQGMFEITSGSRGSGMFVFTGQAEVEEGQVHLKGQIDIRKRSLYAVYGSTAIMSLFGILLILTWNPVFFVFGLMLMIVPWFNYFYMVRSNALYMEIQKKLTTKL